LNPPPRRWRHFCHVLTFCIKNQTLSLTLSLTPPPLSMRHLPCQRQGVGEELEKLHLQLKIADNVRLGLTREPKGLMTIGAACGFPPLRSLLFSIGVLHQNEPFRGIQSKAGPGMLRVGGRDQ
jgi:hypothetical protein